MELQALTTRAKHVCKYKSVLNWGREDVRREGKAVAADLEELSDGKLDNLRCLHSLYSLLGDSAKVLKATEWTLAQPWCTGSSAQLEPEDAKVPSKCFAMTMSERLTALLDLGRMKQARREFKKAVKKRIGGRKAVHWSSIYQLAPFAVPGLRAQPLWEPAAELLPLARLLEANHALIAADLDRILADKSAQWGYGGITPTIISRGDWLSFPLLQNMVWDSAHCAVAASTCSLLRERRELVAEPSVRFAGNGLNINTSVFFARLPPGSGLRLHPGGHNTRLDLHLPLRGVEGARISIAKGAWQSYQVGRVKAFDDSFVHAVSHNGTEDRIVLVVFMWHPDFLRTVGPEAAAAAEHEHQTCGGAAADEALELDGVRLEEGQPPQVPKDD
jgi:hypothetical protein